MGKPKGGGETSKKAQGQARKAEAAASKKAAANAKAEAAEAQEWEKGSKSNAKAEAAAQKKAEADRKKAEKEALLKAEEASLPSKAKGAGAKSAQKKTKGSGLDDALSSLDRPSTSRKASDLHATGIDNALDALSLTQNTSDKIDRHPERRFKAAYTQYEERRLEEMRDEKGLRRNQKIEQIRKEFEKHPDNPFNQAHATYDASKDELRDMQEKEKTKIEGRLVSPPGGR